MDIGAIRNAGKTFLEVNRFDPIRQMIDDSTFNKKFRKEVKSMSYLQGRKTYILTFFGGLVVVLAWLGKIDTNTTNTLLGLLGFGSIAALRHGINE